MAFQVSAWLGISLLQKSEKAAKLGELFGQTGNSIRDISCSISWWHHRKTEQPMYYIYSRGLIPSCVCSLVGGSVSESLHVSRLVDTDGLFMDFLFIGRPLILSKTLLKDTLCSVQCQAVGLCICFTQVLDGHSQSTIILSIRKCILSNFRDW